jgi:hypothetical protein
MWDFVVEFVENAMPLSVFLGVALVLLTVASIACAVSQSVSAYVGTAAVLAGGFLFLNLQGDVRLDANFSLAVAIALTYGGATYLLFGFIGWAVRQHRESRKSKGEACRVQYALPARGNDYVRARLRAISNADDEICPSTQSRESFPTELAYARELLAKVREQELSATDILQAEELGKLFALYGKKEGFSYADVRTVNEGFCCLLKLAAKYAVEP